ncbi:amidase signature domain-containing protein [Lasiosphaeris hirsuta]|uniref:Amidase signature domain-containing protein n=1 Tax=Lasiosphaeris hirsuta TaxID=260670 RepID=A0AA39ZR71_9PEZI|nr:amidase signature domain-containing protein [Lasiosphaeris hirsuta]
MWISSFIHNPCSKSNWLGEANNHILGYNLNPRNQGFSSGGSSSGEGAMQALRGSAVRFGTDIGGSVSMPAAFNGVFSIKPSVGRLPTLGMPNSSPGQMNIATVPGLLANSNGSLRLVLKAVLSTEPWLTDPDVHPIPWRKPQDIKSNKLAFGFMETNGIARSHPPILRALNMAKNALQQKGHKGVIPWQGSSHQEASEIHVRRK